MVRLCGVAHGRITPNQFDGKSGAGHDDGPCAVEDGGSRIAFFRTRHRGLAGVAALGLSLSASSKREPLLQRPGGGGDGDVPDL